MCPETDYAPCPECAADNVIYRSACWRCGAALPYSLGLDGRMHRNMPPCTPREKPPIEILLDTARERTIEREGEQPYPECPNSDPATTP